MLHRLTKVLVMLGLVIGLNLLFKLFQVFQGQFDTRELVSLGFSAIALIICGFALKDSLLKRLSGK